MYNYIYLKYGAGLVDYVPADVTDYNFNPAKGELFCNYEAVLDENTISGETITGAGLSVDKSLESIIAAQSAAFKKSNEKLVVSMTLTLKQEGNYRFLAQPDGTDNMYVRSILRGLYHFFGFQIGVCQDFLPFDAEYFDESAIVEKKNATGMYLGNNYIYSCAAFSAPVKEIVLFYEDRPVLRTLPDVPVNVKLSNITASSPGSVVLTEDYIIDVFNVTVDDTSTPAFFVSPCADTLSYLSQTDYKTGADAVVKNGINNKSILVDSYGITLADDLMPCKWFSGFDAKIVANGSVIIFGEKISIFDGSVTRELNIKPGLKNEAVFSGGIYLIVTSDDKNTAVHRVNMNTYAVQTTAANDSGNVALVDIFGCYIAAISSAYACVYTVVGTESALTSWLNGIKPLIYADRNPVFESGRLMFFDGTNSHYVNFAEQTAQYVNGRAYNDFVVTFDGAVSSIRRLDNTAVVLTKVQGRVTGITKSGSRLCLTTGDGRLLTYLIGSKKTRLHSSAIKASSKISHYARYSLPYAAAVTVNIKVDL